MTRFNPHGGKCNKAHLFLFFRALALGTRDTLVELLRGVGKTVL